jgi:EAL domain-containing protein (putative c-di-GMP-specific phosphodiesterase class I)
MVVIAGVILTLGRFVLRQVCNEMRTGDRRRAQA